MSQIQEWYYAHDADITFGEVHASKAPKIILAVVLSSLVAAGICTYALKDYIYDYSVNPQLTLVKDVTHEDGGIYIDIEYKDEFIPESYINATDLSKVKYNYEIENNVNTEALGDYTVIYKSSNKAHKQEIKMIVHVKDTTNPRIELNADLDETGRYVKNLIRGEETETFDPKDYIKSVTDNYSSDVYMSEHIEYTENINFDYDSATVIYQATDENGNVGVTSLVLNIRDDTSGLHNDLEEAQKELDEIKRQQELEHAKIKKDANDYITTVKESIEKFNEHFVDVSKKKNVESKISDLEKALKTEDYNDIKDKHEKLRDAFEALSNDVAKKEAEDKAKKETTTTKNDNNGNGGNNGGGGNPQPAQTQPPQQTQPPAPATTQPPRTPTLYADPVTISITAGPDAVMNACIAALHYLNGSGVAQPSGIPGYDFQLEVGTYTVTWTTTDGLSCTQTVTITN